MNFNEMSASELQDRLVEIRSAVDTAEDLDALELEARTIKGSLTGASPRKPKRPRSERNLPTTSCLPTKSKNTRRKKKCLESKPKNTVTLSWLT